MRLSIAGGQAEGGWDESGSGSFGAVWRRLALMLSLVLVLGCVGVLFGSAKPAGADTVFQSDDVFASVGFGGVNVYDSSGNQLNSLVDNSGANITAGSAFDASGNFYVTDTDTGDISEYAPDGTLMPAPFATGLDRPLSLAFDASGNLYVGQQATPYIAVFNSAGQRQADIGPVTTEHQGVDWIDLSSDECTFYYTTESTDILTYNMCTHTQGPNFNVAPLSAADPDTANQPNDRAYGLKILQNNDVLVADTNDVVLLDPNGNVLNTYLCSNLPGCQGGLFAMAIDPSGTSFWTGDEISGYVWQVNIETGQVMQTINTNAGLLFGLSVDDEINVATAQSTVVTATPTSLTLSPVSGNFSSPTPVSAVLTDSATNTPIPDESVTFTLNGSETCTATTDSTGTATCVITPGEPASSYTLTASFGGDTSQTTPIGSDSSSSTFTVNPDTTSLTYTGPTTAVNGQPITLTGTLTTSTPTAGTPLSSPQPVTLTVGSGATAQSCSALADASGNVSCTIASLDQPTSSETITAGFPGDTYDTPANATSTLSVTEPTVLTVSPASGIYNGSTTVTGTLTDAVTNAPIANEPVTFTVNGAVYCTGTTNSSGIATCSATPTEGAGTYTLTGTFGGDTTLPLQLTGTTSATVNFTVTPAPTSVTYSGATSTFNGQTITLSGVLTSSGSPLAGQTVTLTLGSGTGSGTPAQSCTAVTSSTGAASCPISNVNQPVGPNPVTISYAGTTNYQSTTGGGTVQVGPATTSSTVTVSAASGSYNTPVTVSATLVDTYTGSGAANETITFTVGTQHCTGVTNASGVASCSVTPTGPAGKYTVTASFSGDSTLLPALLANTGSSTLTETAAPTTLTYTGSTSVTSGKAPSLSAVLTSNGTPLSGQTVTFTVGTGSSAQKCSGTTNASGAVSCSICMFNQNASPLPVTVTYGGTSYYAGTTASESVTVTVPTTLSVSAATGANGQSTTVSGTLTNSVTGAGISGQTITLTLNGTQTCSATTGSNGKASCSITPNESAGTYTLAGTFAGNTSVSPVLASSGGSNNFVVTKVPTSITYTGATVVKTGATLTVSATLTSNGSPLPAGQTLVFTLGTGNTVQTCSAATNSTGAASCTITVNQVQGSVALTVAYAGTTTYAASSVSYSESIQSAGGGGGSGGGSEGSGGNSGQGGGSEPPSGGGGCKGM